MSKALRKLFIPAILPSSIISVIKESLMMILPLYVLNIGGSLSESAMIVGLKGLGMMAAGIPAGYLLTKIGDRGVLLGSALLFMASLLLMAFFPSISILMACAVLNGFAYSAWLVGRTAYLTIETETHERGRVMAVTAGTTRLGNIVGPLISGLLIAVVGFSNTIFLFSIVVLSAVILVGFYVSNTISVSSAASYRASLKATVVENRKVLLTAGGACYSLMLIRSCRALLLPLIGGVLMLSESDIGLIISAGALVDALLFYPAGSLMDRLGRKPVFIFSLVVIGLGLCLMPFAQNFWGLIAISILMGIGNGVSSGIIMTVGADVAPEVNRGSFIGLWRLISDVGSTSGPVIIGTMLKISGLAFAAHSVGVLGLMSSVFVLFKLLETNRSPYDEKNK